MLSIRLNEKWQAIIATAGAARRSTTGRSGPTVRDPTPGRGAADAISGGLADVPCYQHERVVRALHVAGDDEIGNRLRRVGKRQRIRKAVPDPVGEQHDGVPGRQRHDARSGVWLLAANETGGRHEPDPGRTTGGIGMQYQTADVPDAEPCHRRGLRIEVRETEHHAAHAEQRGVAAPDEIRERLARITLQRGDGRMCRGRGLLAVAEAVDDRDQGAFPDALTNERSPDSTSPGSGRVANTVSIFKSSAAISS